jgi:ferredoxin/flavodoxin---NADP+ reductase
MPTFTTAAEAQTATARPSAAPAGPAPQRGYNGTIIDIEDCGRGTRIFRIEPDEPISGHAPGRYISLGRGQWEPRYDGLEFDVPEERRGRVISRPYSLSSTLVSGGRIHEPGHRQVLEFYIALVVPGPDDPPAELTPKLWATRPGDRVLLGKRITGRYTLDPIDDPTADILLLGTGTGEAPHNAMVNELARRGHRGRVTVLSTARHRDDFAYLRQHWTLERLWPNYTYIPLPTRDPYDGVKRRVQDILRHPDRATLLGFEPDPDRTHVFLCGNPGMVAPPEWEDDEPTFASSGGALELLHRMGFTLDRKGRPGGNVHFEAFW